MEMWDGNVGRYCRTVLKDGTVERYFKTVL
jgi:hypothetical protein